MDRISNLPDHVVDRILCSLSLFDAVKTCVLARAWRYKWVGLSKLVFDEAFWNHIPNGKEVEVYAAVLLQHIGQLQELNLFVWESDVKSEMLKASIQFALRKGVKSLSLTYYHIDLPCCVYSSTQLTHLELDMSCKFSPPAVFQGLQNLVTFKLNSVYSTNDADKINNFISRCPNIKRIWLNIRVDGELLFHAPKLEYLNVYGILSCICFQETKSLKYMALEVLISENDSCTKKCWVTLGCLVKLQHLYMGYGLLKHLVSSDAPRMCPQMLDQLKVLKLGYVDLSNSKELHGLFCMFASSPNLCELSVQILCDYSEEVDFESYVDLYCGHKFNSLHTVTVDVRTNDSKLDIKIIGFLLGCSPCLEMMSIRCSHMDFRHTDLVNFLKKVMRLTRASPKASIVIL